jgi:large subunit ribosomal protein L10
MPSEKTLSVKRAEVAEIAEDLKNSVATVIVDSRGLTVEEDTALRADLRKAGV